MEGGEEATTNYATDIQIGVAAKHFNRAIENCFSLRSVLRRRFLGRLLLRCGRGAKADKKNQSKNWPMLD